MKGAPTRASLDEHADVAQLVEHHLAKVGVAGSNPVVRSRSEALSTPEGASLGHSLGASPGRAQSDGHSSECRSINLWRL